MSDVRGGRREAGGGEEHLDLAIDRAVREMLDVEPPDGLRGRVLDRLARPDSVASTFTWNIVWIAAPVAAAAILVLALVLPSKAPRPVVNPAATIATAQPTPQPPSPAIAPPAMAQLPPQTVTAKATVRPIRAGHVRAAAADDMTADIVWMDPLPTPPPVTVAGIEAGREHTIRSIEPAPADIPALEIRPISDTPRERRNQE